MSLQWDVSQPYLPEQSWFATINGLPETGHVSDYGVTEQQAKNDCLRQLAEIAEQISVFLRENNYAG